jgi:hypothetical protein
MPPVVRIVQYICAGSDCGATWRILPRFLARHLWRAWTTVERVVEFGERAVETAATSAVPIPARTRQRWRTRLAATARVLVVLLAVSGGAILEGLAIRVGVDATRRELVVAHADLAGLAAGEQMAAAAALVHRTEGRTEGRAESRATALLTVLRVRGIAVPEVERERILAEKDPDRLERWLERAAVAASLDAVLDEPS